MKKLSILFAALLTCTMSFAATKTTTINFGDATGSCNFNKVSVSYTDASSMAWTMAAVGTSSFTANSAYSHIGSSKKPATSITMTGTAAADMNLTSVSVKMGGFGGTVGTVTITVNGESYATGGLNESNDTIISATTAKSLAKDQTIAISVANIAKGVKIYNITYTYEVQEVVATAISIDKTASLVQYKHDTLKATLTPADATTEVVWSSSDESIVTVANGIINAKAVGTAKIYATAGTVSDSCAVTVTAATPITVARAVEIANTVTTNNELAAGGQYVIRGYAVSVDTTNYYKYKNYTVGMADDAAGSVAFKAYRVVPVDGTTIAAVGDYIEVIGDITKYSSTYETAQGGSIEVIKKKTPTSTENAEETISIQKVLRDGQVLLIRDGKAYNVMGQRVD